MRARILFFPLVLSALAAFMLGAPTAHAIESLSGPATKAVPVLVTVDASGRVVGMEPAKRLRPQYRRLIEASIREMITGPAMYDGSGVRSQFVMFMSTDASLRTDGDYDVRFISVKNQPLPSGLWHWARDNTQRVALVDERDRMDRRYSDAENGYPYQTNHVDHYVSRGERDN